MSAAPRRAGTPVKNNETNGSSPRAHAHARTANPSATNGLSRTPSTRSSTPVSARAAARKPRNNTFSNPKTNSNGNNNDQSDEEAREQQAAVIAELKEQLHKAASTSEQYSKQLDVLQLRLDEAVSEQGRLEDQAHEKDVKMEQLDSKMIEHVRQIRGLELAHERERNLMLQEKEQLASREEELQATIQRLKESLSQKDTRINAGYGRNLSRSCKFFFFLIH